MIDRIVSFLTSLRLTVVCLALSLVLVFVGTLAQVDMGLYLAQEHYFKSFFVYWSPAGSDFRIPVWPGGYLIGGVLLANLIAAHLKRFTFAAKKTGILMIHAGIILLLVGQLLTDVMSRESHMRLEEGQTKNYSESDRQSELAVLETSDPQLDHVVVIPERLLAKKNEIKYGALPFTIRVKEYHENSRLSNREATSTAPVVAEQGVGPKVELKGVAPTVKMDERNLPSAVVEVVGATGSLGTWLVSNYIDQPQTFTYENKTYALTLRWQRFYKPFSLHLLDFAHDRYQGTEIPKNFSSVVQLVRPDTGENREVKIYMNNPLRYWGETYYQSGFEPGDKATVLQVVRNPAWLTPYFSVSLVSLGLIVQFMYHLIGFAKRRTS